MTSADARQMNRPFGAVDVSANLKGAVPKPATQKILVALAEKGEVVQKTYGTLFTLLGTDAGCMRRVRAGGAGSQYVRVSRPCVPARAGRRARAMMRSTRRTSKCACEHAPPICAYPTHVPYSRVLTCTLREDDVLRREPGQAGGRLRGEARRPRERTQEHRGREQDARS